MRYLYYNELYEVIPISNSYISDENLKSVITVDLVGYEYGCIDKNLKLDDSNYMCSKDLEVNRITPSGDKVIISEMKLTQCSYTEHNYCRVSIKYEHRKSLVNGDSIVIRMKQSKAFVQLYQWTFESIWGENFDYKDGFSKIVGIFKPDINIKYKFI